MWYINASGRGLSIMTNHSPHNRLGSNPATDAGSRTSVPASDVRMIPASMTSKQGLRGAFVGLTYKTVGVIVMNAGSRYHRPPAMTARIVRCVSHQM
jgi:hypothetical protein